VGARLGDVEHGSDEERQAGAPELHRGAARGGAWGRRRLLRVRVEIEPGVEPMFIELPDTELSVTQHVA